ncbi:proline dehydrogenase family protein [Gloeobacter morelensis]|uniref:L-glutamate gamma-semialdehyde dehydrogenase n=1 Tax=Gloeobacter morelensis MG652769 TaxID=2781736 RepID=A0ABY3PNR3_9CYAN|nr:proline dehydrogenase family protein [Gloeobacter morelensis]UFP95338.1 proline dehydrogenase family protein [Gloeobacter morelensis MG652769]
MELPPFRETRVLTVDPIESETQRIGQSLLAAPQQSRFSFFERSFWDEKLLEWAMADDELRVQLFRFIDCLPALKTSREVSSHLQEYLGSVKLPGPLAKALDFADPGSPAAAVATLGLRQGISQMARRFICGENLKTAVKTIEKLRSQNMAVSLDLLGEAVVSEAEAEVYQQRYLELLSDLHVAQSRWPVIDQIDRADGQLLPRVHFALKLTSLYSQFDAIDPATTGRSVKARLRPILLKARELGAFVHIDMEQSQHKDLILQIFKEVMVEPDFRDWLDTGICLQAYLRSAELDAAHVIAWSKERGYPVTVRLVKGAYWDGEVIRAAQQRWPVPVFTRKADTDAQYEKVLRLLMENHHSVHIAVGSHNARTVALAIALARQHRVPRRAFEVQMLYGMADALKAGVAQQGERLRVYAPYGELLPGMAYLIRRLLENTANTSFLRQSVRPDSDVVRLLAPPAASGEAAPNLLGSEFVNSPDRDFAVAAEREQLAAALAEVRTRFGQTYWPMVGGKARTGLPTLPVANPAEPGTVLGAIGLADAELADEAVKIAHTAWESWSKTPPQARARLLERLGELMEQQRPTLTAWIVYETGKPWRESDADVSEAIDFCRYYALQILKLTSQAQQRDLPGETNGYHYRSRGVAAVIAPWNFPLAILTGMSTAALAAGNTVIMKPAEQASIVAAQLMRLCEQAGFAAGVVNYLPGKGEVVGAKLVAHPRVHLIAFTGSLAVGQRILAEASVVRPGQRHLKRVIAELGGKNAIIVDSDADLDQAVVGVVQSAFSYSGQKCSACSRLIVLEGIYEAFIERLVQATRSLIVGDPAQPATYTGPVIARDACERIRGVIEQAKGRHRLVLEVDVSHLGEGYFIGPTIFADVDPQSSLAQEEIFGPVLAVLKARDFEHAIEIANGTNFALTGGLFSRSPKHIAEARARFEAGNLYINRKITAALVDRQPFGGFRLSGIGSKAGGPDYLLQFVEPVTVTENIQRQGFAPLPGEL